MQVSVNIVNAFIDGNRGGNPAGVVLDADQFNHNQKLAIAKAIGLSETAFVSESMCADVKLEFYTPTRQIAHCGHATVAVFSYLSQIGRVSPGDLSKETIDGTRKIVLQRNMAYMEQRAPQFMSVEKTVSQILTSIGITKDQLIAPVNVVNTGNAFAVIGVDSIATLSQLSPDWKTVESVSESLDLIGYYVFSRQTHHKSSDATTRMFAPRFGIDEEAATGMAAGPLASYLYSQMAVDQTQFIIEQGHHMTTPSPSLIHVNLEVESHNICSLMAGGAASLKEQTIVTI